MTSTPDGILNDPLSNAPENLQSKTVSPARAAIRPLGYLSIGVLWLTLFLLVVGLSGLLPFLLHESVGTLHDSPGMVRLTRDGGEVVAFAIAMALCSLVFGFFFTFLSLASLSQVMLAGTYFFRSFNPKFRGVPLSTTKWVDGAIGPIRAGQLVDLDAAARRAGIRSRYTAMLGKTSISLLPVHPTRWTGIWTTGTILGFIPSGAVILSSSWVGAAYILTIGWILWPITDPLLIAVWVAASVVLTTIAVLRVRRAVRKTFKSWAVTAAPAAPASAA